MRSALPRLLAAALSLALAAGCAPTYRREDVAKTVQALCQTEHRLDVSARQMGDTIAVHLRHEGILDRQGNQIGLAANANEVLGNVLEVLHRVLLSSQPMMHFYLILVSDPAVPGAYLTIVRYMEDVRRANANMIPPTELFARTILDLKYDANLPNINFDQITLSDIQLQQFLSWQLAKRLQGHLTTSLQQQGLSVADVGPCQGDFKNGEFVFTLNVNLPEGAAAQQDVTQQLFQDATSVISKVLADYRFQSFDAIRLLHPATGRSMLLPRSSLELFR
ncbi:MAG: hypothetical protein HYY15_00995 [Candidatus Omnitrophica bacterium]|nr:hypothetical protein [Candidatus Omnitrophota bacterium]